MLIAAARRLLLMLALLALATFTFPTILKLLHRCMSVVGFTFILFLLTTGGYISFIESANARALNYVFELELEHSDKVPDQMHVAWLQAVHRILQNERSQPLRRHPPLRIIHTLGSQQCYEGRVNPVPQQRGFLEGNVEIF